jgi:hypothetical protein
MAIKKEDEGIIKNELGEIRYDSGEDLKGESEAAPLYEKDYIELKGILYFALGLILLIGVTFWLMWLFQSVMEEQTKNEDKVSPMALTKPQDRLPPEPRLQAAPGFGVQTEKGWENLELREPQAEYRELRKQWEKIWKEGEKDAKTGTVITLPIEEAKKKVLEQTLPTRNAQDAQKAIEQVRQIPSSSSAGRATETRRQ